MLNSFFSDFLGEEPITERQQIGELLVDLKCITPEQLQEALKASLENPELKLGEVMVKEGMLTEELLYKALLFQAWFKSTRLEPDILIQRKEMLKKVYLFKDLTEKELSALLFITREKYLAKETPLFFEGDEGSELYIIISGKIKISKRIPGGPDQILATLSAGDYLGEMALIDDFPRSATATVQEDCLLLSLQKEDFDSLLSAEPLLSLKLYKAFTKTLSTRLRETNKKLKETEIQRRMEKSPKSHMWIG
ncbi:MAG: cyclic nucleotide-binding domain-containing protein [Candidatus Edwardsbacteria bacterium]